MDKVVFNSYKPYLHICLLRVTDGANSIFVTFGKDCTYSPTNKRELKLLRGYAEATKHSYTISEVLSPAELKQKNEEIEAKEIQEAEKRIDAKIEEERKRQEEHEFYSALRFSDIAYR